MTAHSHSPRRPGRTAFMTALAVTAGYALV